MYGKSLIRTSPNYAFANMSLESVLIANGTLPSPFVMAFQLIRDNFGPFGSIDVKHVPFPNSLVELYRYYINELTLLFYQNLEARNNITLLPTFKTGPFPATWIQPGGITQPGHFLCDTVMGTPPLTIWAYPVLSGGCTFSTWRPELSSLNYVFMLLASGVYDQDTNKSLARIQQSTCPRLTVYAPATLMGPCVSALRSAQAVISTYFSPEMTTKIRTLAKAVEQDILALKVEHIQYIVINNTKREIRRMNLFDPNNVDFHFTSWHPLLQWVTGSMEVLKFQGDLDSVTMISQASPVTSISPSILEVPVNVAIYFRGCLLYVTSVLVGISAIACLYIILTCFRVEGLNMFEFNRVAGIVWVGRPLLFLRSMVAICLLSTGSLSLEYVPVNGMTHFVSQPLESILDYITLLLGAGEMGWFVYVVSDILTIVTQDYTSVCAVTASSSMWIIAGILSIVSPVTPISSIRRECKYDQMDFQLVCESATIQIGSFTRFIQLIVIALALVILTYIIERIRRPKLKTSSRKSNSLFLASGAKYMFDDTHWMHNDTLFLDKASSAINGVLSFTLRGQCYIMDVKTWRTYVMTVPTDMNIPKSEKSRLLSSIALFDNNAHEN